MHQEERQTRPSPHVLKCGGVERRTTNIANTYLPPPRATNDEDRPRTARGLSERRTRPPMASKWLLLHRDERGGCPERGSAWLFSQHQGHRPLIPTQKQFVSPPSAPTLMQNSTGRRRVQIWAARERKARVRLRRFPRAYRGGPRAPLRSRWVCFYLCFACNLDATKDGIQQLPIGMGGIISTTSTSIANTQMPTNTRAHANA